MEIDVPIEVENIPDNNKEKVKVIKQNLQDNTKADNLVNTISRFFCLSTCCSSNNNIDTKATKPGFPE
jgi:hypothetical protein